MAIMMGATISVLAIVPESVDAAMHLSRVSGHVGFDSEHDLQETLDDSLAWLRSRKVVASAYLAHGNVIDVILEYSRRLQIDLIVVGHYPKPRAARWWTNTKGASLAEHSACSVFISIGA
jgi:nucleotide-binding universal stress UspA family protein